MAAGPEEKSRSAVAKHIVQAYTYVAIWICLSATVILYNKWVLFFYKFPYPLALTMIHMGFCSVLAFIIIRVLGWVQPLDMTSKQYVTQSFHAKIMTNMIVISIGVAVASYGEINFVPTGVFIQLAAIVAEAVRLVMVQILLTSQGVTMNPITSLYYISPVCFLFLLVPFTFLELPTLRNDTTLHWDSSIFLSNAGVAFLLNLAVFLLIGKTSALTMNVAGVVKDWLLIGLSAWLFYAPVTPLNLIGYSLAFAAVCWYNYQKLQAMKSRELAKATQKDEGDAEADREPTVKSPLLSVTSSKSPA
eukprot:jgi/Chlat1/6392/Chrsp44S05840